MTFNVKLITINDKPNMHKNLTIGYIAEISRHNYIPN